MGDQLRREHKRSRKQVKVERAKRRADERQVMKVLMRLHGASPIQMAWVFEAGCHENIVREYKRWVTVHAPELMDKEKEKV